MMFSLSSSGGVVQWAPFTLHVLLMRPESQWVVSFFSGQIGSALGVVLHTGLESLQSALAASPRSASQGLVTDLGDPGRLFGLLGNFPEVPVLVVVHTEFDEKKVSLFPHPAVGGLLAPTFFAHPELAVMALRQFFLGSGWDIWRVYPEAPEFKVENVLTLALKEEVVADVETIVAKRWTRRLGGLAAHLGRRVAVMADELLANAIAAGEVEGSAREKTGAVLSLWLHEDLVHLAVIDTVGGLKKDAFTFSRPPISTFSQSAGRESSAGIGLKSVLKGATLMICRVEEQARSEVHAAVAVADSLRKIDGQAKSLLFIGS